MRQVRVGVFETNSSSTHTLVIMTKEQHDKFKKGELFLDGSHNVLTKEQIEAKYKDSIEKWHDGDVDDFIASDNLSYESFYESAGECEDFLQEYTSPSGEKIVVFGYFGYS